MTECFLHEQVRQLISFMMYSDSGKSLGLSLNFHQLIHGFLLKNEENQGVLETLSTQSCEKRVLDKKDV